jgi:hypothetical protein
MHFIVDSKKKIIFGWSAKCGCSHIKNIYWFLQTDKENNLIHTQEEYNCLPNDIQNYTTLVFIRNPYTRIISGFLDKYKPNGYYRHRWKGSFLSFYQFVDKVVNKDWTTIDEHHFIPQTAEYFDNKIFLSKNIKFYDINNIDYKYIEQLYNKKIHENVISKKYGHERQILQQQKNNYVYNLNIDDYIDYNIDIKYFYNDEIKEKVFNFYIDDFNIFKDNGIDYINKVF